MNAPARWNVNVADFNVEKVYSISQLLSEWQSTSLWVLRCRNLVLQNLNYAVRTERDAAIHVGR